MQRVGTSTFALLSLLAFFLFDCADGLSVLRTNRLFSPSVGAAYRRGEDSFVKEDGREEWQSTHSKDEPIDFSNHVADDWYLRDLLDEGILWVETALLREEWCMSDVRQISQALSSATIVNGPSLRTRLLVAGFVQLLITETSSKEALADTMHTSIEGFSGMGESREDLPPPSSYLSKELLLAAIWHCLELLQAQQLGLNNVDAIRRNILRQDTLSELPALPTQTKPSFSCLEIRSRASVIPIVQSSSHGTSFDSPQLLPLPTKSLASTTIPTLTLDPTATTNAQESVDLWNIGRGAAQMHRAEVLTRAVSSAPTLSKEEGKRLRGLLLTVPEFDWRSLLIRCVTCLYFLENTTCRTPETTRAAREGMYVYGSFAEQLGLPGLKARIEDAAFRILYQRQYATVKSMMYQGPKPGSSMQATATFLEGHIKASLYTDDLLKSQQAEVFVTSRVKEPFSLWKKLVAKRNEKLRAASSSHTSALALRSSSSLSVSTALVPDFVALRVVLQVTKLTEDESPETTKAREQLLCYYVQEKIQALWPLHDRSRMKDYIQFPKPNGYQSLHFISKVSFGGFDLPFEVQVRTNEMHKHAEYGAASHWGYKLGAKDTATTLLLPSLPQPCGTNPYLQALSLSQKETANQTIYVFVSKASETSSGKVMAVPPRTTLKDLSEENRTLLLNGKPAPQDVVLQSGDVVLVS